MPLSKQEWLALEKKAFELRKLTLQTTMWAGSGHIGGGMSVMDMMTVLYHKYMRLDKNNPNWDMQQKILDQIGVVPNPYYSYSTYETLSQLETKVRFVNVPANTVISIYTVDGTLVRRLGPTTGSSTTVDWDLHNHNGLPIAGGMYLIHVEVPNIGYRVIKWFGTMRPVDLNSFGF